jgi:putative CocE/NonD family hydrolase
MPTSVLYDVQPTTWQAVTSRRDVLTYTTEPLAQETEITGQILAKVWVSSTAPDTDFTLRLLRIGRDGGVRDVTAAFGRLRARYRNTEDEARPEPLRPGVPVELTVGLGYTSQVVPAGERLQLVVMGSMYPYVHPNTWEDFTDESQVMAATNTVYHDAEHPSRVILPVISGSVR